MLASHVRQALRHLRKNKIFSLLNITGLAVGMAGALLIFAYVADELRYDRFHEKADQIYRLNLSGNWAGEEVRGSGTPPPLAAAMRAAFPEVEAATRVYPPGDLVVRSDAASFTASQVLGVDADFFDVFSFPLVEGDPRTALRDPNTLVLTRSAAVKYFGDAPALGQTLMVGDARTACSVTGVVEDPPAHSHFDFEMLASMASFPEVERFDWSWIWLQLVTYVVLDERADPAVLDAKIPALVARHGRDVIEHFSGTSFEAFERQGGRWSFTLQPLTRIHLYSQDVGNRLGPVSDIQTVYVAAALALFLLLIACINFMNLSTARATRRAKEVGVRKVFGSYRHQLVGQFLIESTVASLLALLVALGLVYVALGPFNALTGKQLAFDLLGHPSLLAAAAALALGVGLLAGSYPAFYLTSIKPAAVLKGNAAGPGNRRLRGVLVGVQFALSIGFLISTLIVSGQLRYVRSADLGFDRENVLVVSHTERLGPSERAFKQALLAYPEVAGASFSSSLPSKGAFGDFYDPEASDLDNVLLNSVKGDYDFVATLGLQLRQGRTFSRAVPTDAEGVLVNQAAVRHFGWEEPLGKTLTYPGHDHQKLTIIGVLEDFHFFSLHQRIEPFAIFLFESDTYTLPTHYLSVRIAPGDVAAAVARVEQTWKTLAPDAPFDYAFLDEAIDAQFRSEQRLGRVFTLCSLLAVFVACLGLFGLAAFSAAQRTKEIGIRKVLGASAGSILVLLSKEFVWLVVLANVVAWPVAYLGMRAWLDGFAYRMDLNAWPFVAAAGAALALALLTTSYHALKAAVVNPVDSLRHE